MKPYKAPRKKLVLDYLEKGMKVKDVAKLCKVHPATVYAWRKEARRGRAPGVSPAPKIASKANGNARDAIVYLRHARSAMIRQVVEERDKLENPVYMFALMALNALEGRS